MMRRQAARQQARHGGERDGHRGHGIGKPHAGGRQRIERRGGGARVAIAAQVIRAERIDHDQDDGARRVGRGAARVAAPRGQGAGQERDGDRNPPRPGWRCVPDFPCGAIRHRAPLPFNGVTPGDVQPGARAPGGCGGGCTAMERGSPGAARPEGGNGRKDWTTPCIDCSCICCIEVVIGRCTKCAEGAEQARRLSAPHIKRQLDDERRQNRQEEDADVGASLPHRQARARQ